MKKVLFFSLLFVGTVLSTKTGQAADTVTIIATAQRNSPQFVATDFAEYGLRAKVFEIEDVKKMTADTEQALCQSIDDSLLMLFAAATPADVFDKTFSSEPVANSIKKLLEKGGMLYFDPLYDATLSWMPVAMAAFFKQADAFLIRRENHDGQCHSYVAAANPDFKHPFTAEISDDDMRKDAAEFSFVGTLPESCKALLVDRNEPVPLMLLQEGVFGNGKIINSYVYSITRSAQNALMGNILRTIYGEKKK